MRFEITYPQGKPKALTFSYDDAQVYDRRLVEIFDWYGMKGTFHLNSGTLDTEGFLTSEEVENLYKNHEVACHGVQHLYLTHLHQEDMVREIWEDRKNLEKLVQKPVTGFSYAFGEYNEQVVACIQNLGMQYARTVEATHKFIVPDDFMKWKPTCHHDDDLLHKVEEFLHTPEYGKLPLFYIWGHSFEFQRNDNWELMEEACRRLAGKEDVWYTTNIEYMRYIQACKSLISSVDGQFVYNPSGISVYAAIQGKIQEIKSGETLRIDYSKRKE